MDEINALIIDQFSVYSQPICDKSFKHFNQKHLV